MSIDIPTHLGSRRLSLRRQSVVPLVHPRPLRPVTLGNYGDEFDQTVIDPAWANTSGTAPTSALAIAGSSWATVTCSGAGTGYTWKAAPSGDFTVTAGIHHPAGLSTNLQGLMVLDSSGNGVGLAPYNSPDQWLFTTVTAGAYGGSFNQAGTEAGIAYQSGGAMGWYRINKSGTTYTAQVATDKTGTAWSTASTSFTGPSTATQIAIGRWQNLAGTATVTRVDWIAVTQ